MEALQHPPKLHVRIWKAYRTHDVPGGYTNVEPVSVPVPVPAVGYLMWHSHIPGIVLRAYITYVSSGYACECRT